MPWGKRPPHPQIVAPCTAVEVVRITTVFARVVTPIGWQGHIVDAGRRQTLGMGRSVKPSWGWGGRTDSRRRLSSLAAAAIDLEELRGGESAGEVALS